eukprot:UN03671
MSTPLKRKSDGDLNFGQKRRRKNIKPTNEIITNGDHKKIEKCVDIPKRILDDKKIIDAGKKKPKVGDRFKKIKKPRGAYNLFCSHMQKNDATIKVLQFAERSRACSVLWKDVTPDEKNNR